jgi:imidazoleglycerol-phosphate dehydratase / histidinol-phosphatase
MQKYLFIDRDGTIIESPPSPEQIDSIDKLHFYPNVITWLGRIAAELSFKLVMVTNQNGLGTDEYPEENFLPAQNFMLDILKREGIIFSEIIIDGSHTEENSPLRKPRTGRMHAYMNNVDVDMKNSFVIGDRYTDVQFAKNLGCKGILLHPENQRGLSELTDSMEDLKTNWTALASSSWKDVYAFLRSVQPS